jgi:hypothetical protein
MDPRYDTRDAAEHAAVAAILAELPADHPACVAYAEHVDTIQLTHLVGRMDLADRLKEAYLDGYRQLLKRSASHFRP